MQKFYKQINGVNIIHYNPTGLAQIQNMIKASEIRNRLEKELNPKIDKARNYTEVVNKLKEILEITERASLQERVEATGCDY
jgi:cell division protein FtsX